MLVISSGSDTPLTVRLYSLTSTAEYAPAPVIYHAPALTPAERSAVLATARLTVDHAPHYSIVDTHGDGCAAYYAPHWSLVPEYADWQAQVISAIQRLRRWRYYSDSPD